MTGSTNCYENIRQRMDVAAIAAARAAHDVRLLAVSKRQSISAIKRIAALGQREFGENYLQEAQTKIVDLAGLNLTWHYIGQVQSNKTRLIASLFDWVHSVDRLKIAERLNVQRPELSPPLNICVEVNISGEARKGGIAVDEVPEFVDSLAAFNRLRVRGLMALPAPNVDIESQRAVFRLMHETLSKLNRPAVTDLSMGTSDDFEAAIAEGATLVRIGTALFGKRV
ncbi:MAG: pyridoxal phosphate enzyme (YggS family) [Gammaproteobacteria bacterium]|jgi:pyridoxal phosphate enzyme (YggS family)